MPRATALYAYDRVEEDELSIQPGELLDVIPSNTGEDDWITVRNKFGRVGLVPGNYIRNELPPHWVALVDPESNDTYYHNERTGKWCLLSSTPRNVFLFTLLLHCYLAGHVCVCVCIRSHSMG